MHCVFTISLLVPYLDSKAKKHFVNFLVRRFEWVFVNITMPNSFFGEKSNFDLKPFNRPPWYIVVLFLQKTTRQPNP